MQVKQEAWTISKLGQQKDRINLNPQWQRGPAWKMPRQVLLIDSILRGMDIPKVYLRQLNGGIFSYDAVDGQQRLRAIWLFHSNELPLTYTEPLERIAGHDVNGKTFAQLPKSLRDRFTSFGVSVARIVAAKTDEITQLFARLQMGVQLNPAELRNALLQSPVRHVVETLASSHVFFINSRISDARYKRQDYVTHVMALAGHGLERDIKAPDLKKFMLEYGNDHTDAVLAMAAQVGDALNVLDEVNQRLGFRLVEKWLFVDLCWFVMQREASGTSVDSTTLAERFASFNALRKKHTGKPEQVLEAAEIRAPLRKHLFAYLEAFKTQAGTKEQLATRARALSAFCADS